MTDILAHDFEPFPVDALSVPFGKYLAAYTVTGPNRVVGHWKNPVSGVARCGLAKFDEWPYQGVIYFSPCPECEKFYYAAAEAADASE